MDAGLLLVRLSPWLLRAGIVLAVATFAAVVLERVGYGVQRLTRRYIDRHFAPLIGRALRGDSGAVRQLVAIRPRHRITVARLLIEPLIDDRDPARIARTRAIVRRMSIVRVADGYLRSWWWWRRALALRALGLIRVRNRAGAMIAALDDANADVRAAALDALSDLKDVRTLQALVVRLHDPTLHHGRLLAALVAFGSRSEPLLIDLSQLDPAHRADYARAFAICGTSRSRAALSSWARDPRPDVRAAAFEALAQIGLDEASAALAVAALDRDVEPVRAMAARALHGWLGPGNAAARLADHLDDTWSVAVRAAQSLASLGRLGIDRLQASASRRDLAGVLARQMLWEKARWPERASRSLRSAS